MDIKDIIENEFGIVVNNVFVLGEGLDSVAYRINDEYIFKMSKHDEARKNMKKEIDVLNYLKGKISLQIPVIEFYSEKYSVCGYKELKGEKLTKDIYDSMSMQEKENLVCSIAGFLNELHSLPLPEIDDLELNIIDDYKSDYDLLKKLIYDIIPESSKKYLDS